MEMHYHRLMCLVAYTRKQSMQFNFEINKSHLTAVASANEWAVNCIGSHFVILPLKA